MDHDVMWRRVNELWALKPMLDEMRDRWEEHRAAIDKGAEAERAARVLDHAEEIKRLVAVTPQR